MGSIKVKHSSIVIEDYTMGDSNKLEYNFMIYDRLTHTRYFKGLEYDENNKRLIIPRGLDVAYIESLLDRTAETDYNCDPREYNETPINIKYLPRDEVQKEALAFMLGEKLKYKNNQRKSQLSVNLNTGKGKTYCSVVCAAFLNLRTMIVTTSTEWLKQWKDCILEYTDVREDEIFMMVGTPSINKLMSSDMKQYKFILASHATIRSYGETYGWEAVTELFKHTKIGLKFYDESHLNFDNMCKIDFYTNTYKTYYVTATPMRSSQDENKIFQLYFKNVPSINLFNEEDDPHTKYIAIRYSSKPSPRDISNCKNAYGMDRNKYVKYLMGRDNYYKILTIVMDLVMRGYNKTLMYIGTNEAISITKAWLENNYPELRDDVGIFTSVTPKEQKENELQKRIILSTTKSCGAAVDIRGLKCTVVLAEPFKSEVLARQTLGRTRDDNTTYIEIVDTGFSQLNKYYLHKRPVFAKYATSCTEINMKDPQLNAEYDKIMYIRNNMKYPIFNMVKMKPDPKYLEPELTYPIYYMRKE